MQRILSHMRKAIEEYNMIEGNDKIAICLSGGKDSITMLYAFKALQRFYPKKFEIIAISIDPGFEFFNTDYEELLQAQKSLNKCKIMKKYGYLPLYPKNSREYKWAMRELKDIQNEYKSFFQPER